jgi:acyl carrier protein
MKELKMSAVEEKVKEIIIKIVRKPELDFTPTTTFKDMEADSLDIVQILVALEDTYDIEIIDEDLQEIANMGDFVAYIERKVAARQAA